MRQSFPSGSLATALRHASRLLETRPELAEAQAREILIVHPAQPEAELVLARALIARGVPQEARPILIALTTSHPGHPQAWRELGDLNRAVGDRDAADAAYARHVETAAHNPQLLEAGRELLTNRLAVAERLLRDYLKRHSTDIAAIRMLAEIGSRLGRYEEAEKLLARCLEIAPRFRMARQNYATVLYRQNKATEAIAETELLLAEEPDDPGLRALKAAALGQIGEYDKAVVIYETLLKQHANEPKAWMSYGHSLRALGRAPESIAAYRRAVSLLPGLGEAWFSLANTKTYRFAPDEIVQMGALVAQPGPSDEDRWHLHFALGKAFEDTGSYQRSFGHYREGNRLRRLAIDYDCADMTEHVTRSRTFFTPEFFDARRGAGATDADPIFIVGLPRSGSTLIEQILASHSRVEGTMELPDIVSIARRLGGKKKRSDTSIYPEMLAGLGSDELEMLGKEYLERTRIHRRLGRARFTDKMPNNFAHVGLIHLILPNAKIIDVRRYPLACCFSLFKQHFARGQGFSYDLNDIGRYYLDYASLMEHFDRALPGRIHRVLYEELIREPEREIRRLLAYCALPWEDACLRFHENERPVRSASSEQVRQPLFSHALEHWRHYEAWLAPLKSLLAPVIATYPAASISGG